MGSSIQPEADPLEQLKALAHPSADPLEQLKAFHPSTAATTPAPTPAPRSGLYNAVNTVDNALTFGLGQKFNAAFNAVGDKLTGKDSFTHSYARNLDAEQTGIEQFRQAHPYGAAALGAVGGAGQIAAAAPVLAAGEMANGLSMGARALAAARTGGALGAVNALGNAPAGESLTASAKRALYGGAAGSLMGAGAVPAAEIIAQAAAKLGRAAGPLASKALDGVSSPGLARIGAEGTAVSTGTPLPTASPSVPKMDRASQLLLQRLQRAGLTPQEAMDRLAQIDPSKPVSVMEVAGATSQPVRDLGKWVARTPSAGAGQIRAAIEARSEPLSSAQRVLGDVSEAMGAPRTNLVENAAQLKGQQLANAKPHYTAAFAEDAPPVPLSARVDEESPSLGDLLKRPSIRGAVKFHNEIAAERGEDPIALPNTEAAAALDAQKVPDGFSPESWAKILDAQKASGRGIQVSGGEGEQAMPLKTLQQLKFKLDDVLGFAKRNGQLPDGTPATNAKLGAINQTRVALLDIMKAHSPEFAAGNESWAGDAALQTAGESGREFLSRPFDELQHEFPTLTAGEQQQHNLNAVSGPIRDRLYGTLAIDRAKTLTSPNIQERLQTVVPSERMDPLQRRIATEHQIALTNQQVPNGSDTYANATNDADIGGSRMTKGVLTSLLGGRTRGAARAVIGGIVRPSVDAWVHGINESTANALAPKLAAGMASRQELMAMLEELATKHNALLRRAPTIPLPGMVSGVTLGQFPNDRKY